MTKQTVLLLGVFALIVVGVFAFIGCGAIIHGSSQNISFQTTPSGATVEVLDAVGMDFGACETPCTIKLPRKRDYKVFISKPGYESSEMIIQKGTSGWIWGNIFFGGLIGVIIDFTSGSAYKLTPESLEISLNSFSSSIPDIKSTEGIVFIDFENLTDDEKAKIRCMESFDWPTSVLTIR